VGCSWCWRESRDALGDETLSTAAAGHRYLDASEEDRDARYVMTSLHAADSVEDVSFFFVLNTNFDEQDVAEYVALHLGGTPAEQLVV
jgi:hypothetical protein